MATSSRIRRSPLKANHCLLRAAVVAGVLFSQGAFGQTPAPPVTVTLDQAIQMALQHNHNMLAMMTTIQQSHLDSFVERDPDGTLDLTLR